MRILFWSDLYWPFIGGAEVFASRLMASLKARGVEFLVVTSHHDRELPDADEHEGIPIRRLPFRAAIAGRDPRVLLRAIAETAAIKREFAPDVIHMNGVGASALFHLRSSAATSAPLLVTLQQEVLPSQAGGGATLMAQVLEQAAWVVGCSGAVLAEARAAYPSIEPRSSRIYNGVDPPSLPPARLPAIPHVLCLGRLVPAKGWDIALRAFALLAPRFPAARFTIAGDGVAREELEALANDLHVTVDFRGWVDPATVPALLNGSSIVVMPSRREGLPIVAVQAALMARPIIATAAGGLPEVVLDGESGLLVPPEDPEALATAVESLIDDRGRAEEMGRAGRVHVLSALDWERTVSSYDSLYRSLLETPTP